MNTGCLIVVDRFRADLLEGVLANGHFQDSIQGDNIVFDYCLRSGRAQRTNALDILAHLGYPTAIVEQARAISGRSQVLA